MRGRRQEGFLLHPAAPRPYSTCQRVLCQLEPADQRAVDLLRLPHCSRGGRAGGRGPPFRQAGHKVAVAPQCGHDAQGCRTEPRTGMGEISASRPHPSRWPHQSHAPRPAAAPPAPPAPPTAAAAPPLLCPACTGACKRFSPRLSAPFRRCTQAVRTMQGATSHAVHAPRPPLQLADVAVQQRQVRHVGGGGVLAERRPRRRACLHPALVANGWTRYRSSRLWPAGSGTTGPACTVPKRHSSRLHRVGLRLAQQVHALVEDGAAGGTGEGDAVRLQHSQQRHAPVNGR